MPQTAVPRVASDITGGDTEISFEDALGQQTAGPKAPVGQAGGPPLIDFNEAAGIDTQKVVKPRTPVDVKRLTQMASLDPSIAEPSEEDNWGTAAAKTLYRATGEMTRNPVDTTIGAGKALAGGIVSMGEAAVAGGEALGAMWQGIQLGVPFDQLVSHGVEASDQSFNKTQKLRTIVGKIADVNLAPENLQEQEMENLLMVLPEGITAAGDTVFEKTGSALAGAGSQALLTLLTFKPSLVSKSLKGFRSRPEVKTSFEGLAKTDPQGAEALAKHVETVDPQLAALLKAAMEKTKEIPAEELGVKAAKTEITTISAGKPKIRLKPQVTREVTQFKDPEPIQTGSEPQGVGIGDRWEVDRGAVPGEPFAYLDGDTETASAAIVEVEKSGRQGSHFEARTVGGDLIGKFTTPAEAARAAEKYIGIEHQPDIKLITPEEAGVGVSKAVEAVQQAADQGPKGEVRLDEPKLISDNDTGQHTVTAPGVDLLAQENRSFLQVKRADVAAEVRGQGKAQEAMSVLFEEAQRRGLTLSSDFSVSPDAQRVYNALGRKGFTVKENPSVVNPDTGNKISTDPRVPVYEVTKAPVSEAALQQATQIFANGITLGSLPGGEFAKGKLKAWYEEAIRTIAPEALGKEAKMSAAVLASKIAESMNKDSANWGRSKERRVFWEKQTPEAIRQFMKDYEQGKAVADPVMQKALDNLRVRNKEVYDQDQKVGIKYDPVDNYLYHVFEDGDKLASHFQAKYGAKWGDPKFTKERSFDLYEEAIKAGFKPKFTNPEELMLARQHASDVAQMKVELLRDLETYGLAKKISKGDKDPPKTQGKTFNYRRSPTGDGYWVDSTADSVLHNAFDTKSLWNMPGFRGDVFKSAMFLKNTIVPIKLALSLFHPLHVATIDNATGMVRASKALLSGKSNPVQWLGQMLDAAAYGSKGIPFKGLWDNPVTGNRILRAYQGKVPAAALTAADTLSLQYMAEGGMIPEMSAQYKTGAIDSFRKAINQRSATAAWHLPFAVIQAMGKPMFEIWIPSLKIASYLKDVQTAIKTDPGLVNDKGRRLLAFRKLAKSVDNRYGEMAYNTLFWNRTVKDLAVANTLSLGWNLGFIREYGGGAMDIGQSVTRAGNLAKKASQGMLDRPLFVTFYTTQALLYGGLLTWALTGKSPSGLMDYIYPKSGNQTSDGRDERVNTMFYPREFAAIQKHIEHEGIVSGIGHLVSNKASGVVGLVSQWASGVNDFGQEIRDPESPAYKQIQDTLKATMLDLEPISMKSSRDSPGTVKDVVLAVSGFSKAPKYVTQTDAEATIDTLYKKYNAPKQTPYETAVLSGDRRKLKQLYTDGKIGEYAELLDKMQTKYDLTAKEQLRLAQGVLRTGLQDFNPYKTMFQRLTWQQQKRVLDKMPEDERQEYLPMANREHLRFTYEAPEAK